MKPHQIIHRMLHLGMLTSRAALVAALWISAVVPLAAADSGAFVDSYNVSRLTMNDGLAHNFVDDIYRDSRGFIWFSFAGGGLARYDGYDCLTFNPNNPAFPLKGNFVVRVVEDRFRRLWVASDGGLDIIDLNTLCSILPKVTDSRFDRLVDGPLSGIEADKLGRIWIKGPNGFGCVELDNEGVVTRVTTVIPPYSRFNSNIIKNIDGDGSPWIGLQGRVWRLKHSDNGMLNIVAVDDSLSLGNDVYINDMVAIGSDVWIGTDHGLFRYDRSARSVKKYVHDEADSRSLSQNFVTALAVDASGRLIAATLKGISIYDRATDDFERVGATVDGVLGSPFANCVCVDGDRLWIGTESGGVSRFSPKSLPVKTVGHIEGDEGSLSPFPINAIYEDHDNTLWVGTVEGGLNRRQAGSEKFDHYTRESGALVHNTVSAIAADNADRMWIGSWGGGISVVSRQHPEHRILTFNSAGDSNPVEYISTIIYDPVNRGMWVGANVGLYFYDLSTNRFVEPFDGAAENVIGGIGAIIDRRNTLWVGSMNGLYAIDLRSRSADGRWRYRLINRKLDNQTSEIRERISCLYESIDGTLWVGSDGHGLYRRDVDSSGNETFVNFNTDDGLANNGVRGILEDDAGRLWVATYNGLSCYNLHDDMFVTFGSDDGLTDSQFYWNAACRLRSGEMLFGTIGGMVVVDGDVTTPVHAPHHVMLTRLIVGNEPVTSGSDITPLDISATDAIAIHEHDKSFEVQFSALDYDRDPSCRYRYRLVGFDDEWITLPAGRRHVTYTNLSAGKYRLQVAYLPAGMPVTPDLISELQVSVHPYFYRTVWFIGLVVVMLCCLAFLFYRRRVSGFKLQRQALQSAVAEHTGEIESQRQQLEDRARELSEQNALLRRSNEEISQQKAQLADMARQVQDLTVDRIAFFTNITHEFRTPITLIIGPIERALKLSYNPQVIEQLHFAERNSKYLLSLVNQLMDFRKIESGKMEIVRARGNFIKFIEGVVESFRAFVGDRNITLRTICRMSTSDIGYDEEAMRKVVINLISNAIKFTPDGGCITVYATLLPAGCKGDDPTLYVGVSDTGNGIADEDIDRVFDRFYQGKSQMKYPLAGISGSGIGLYLCKSIVETYGGSISVRNNRRAGCTFRVLLPVPAEVEARESSPASPVSPLAPVASAVDDSSSRQPVTVLVVEDNADMRSFIRSILRDRFTVVEASNGEEALKVLLSQNVDFIISDLMMPVMDGVELSRRVKENFAISHIPFLMLTAKTAQESRLESYKVGVDEYILKPFDEELLLARIDNILENKRRHQKQFSLDLNPDELSMAGDSRDKKFIDQVMGVVRDNYKNSYFEVGDFAEALGISRSLLNKKLQSLAGQSATQFMRNYRMNVARELIEKNRETRAMNISEIAYEVGFNDSKYFTRCFTRHFNMTPSAMMSVVESANKSKLT